jgi:hypothetical protein
MTGDLLLLMEVKIEDGDEVLMVVASFVICFEVEQQEAAATTVFFHPLLF